MASIQIRTLHDNEWTLFADGISPDTLGIALKKLVNENAHRDVQVNFDSGFHDLGAPIKLTHENLPARGYRCVLRSQALGKPAVLRASLPVTNWRTLDRLETSPSNMRTSEILWAKLPDGVAQPRALYAHGTRMPNARSAVFMPKLADKENPLLDIQVPVEHLPDDFALENLTLSIMPNQKWIHNRIPIAEGDKSTGRLRLSVPATYPLAPIGYGWFPEGHAWIENSPSDISEPGQWSIDYINRIVYWWPLPDIDPNSGVVRVPVATEMIRIEGKIEHDGPVDRCVHDVVIENLTFTENDVYLWPEDHEGCGLQHDWEMYDSPSAALRLRGADNCRIERCTFQHLASTAIRLDLSCRYNQIMSNTIEHIGVVGILAAGYGPGRKDVNRHNQIIGNSISYVGESLWHGVGVFLWQSGHNLVKHNQITHCPYSGIVISGRISYQRDGRGQCSGTIRWPEVDVPDGQQKDWDTWYLREQYQHARENLILENDISRVMEMVGDGNGIYLSGAGGGNQLVGNLIHDNDSLTMNAAIRSDDDQHEVLIKSNLIARSLGEGILIKGVSEVRQNLLVDLRSQDRFGRSTDYVRGYFVCTCGASNASVFMDNIVVATIPDHRLFTLGSGRQGGEASVSAMAMGRNYYANLSHPDWPCDYLNETRNLGSELDSLKGYPEEWPLLERVDDDVPWHTLQRVLADHESLGWAANRLMRVTSPTDNSWHWPRILIKELESRIRADE